MKIAASVDLSGLFPFHVVFGRDLEIVQLGRSIAKVCIRSLLGSNFADEFRALRPSCVTFDDMVALADCPLLAELAGTELIFRGQILALDGTRAVFLGTPCIRDFYELERVGLTPGDFAAHDQTCSYLSLLQAQTSALIDANALAKDLSEQQQRLERSNLELLSARLEARLSASASASANAVTPPRSGGHRGRVLVAEDSLVNQEVAAATLRKLGWSVDVVSDGQAALEATLAQRYDVVLMDCQMPGVDGFEATRAIRLQETAGKHLPIVAMTASAMAEDRDLCLAAGMDDYLSKPFLAADLLAVLYPYSKQTQPPTSVRAVRNSRASCSEMRMRLDGLATQIHPAVVSSMIAAYLLEGPIHRAKLWSACHELDGDGLRRSAHALRSASATIGAARLAGLCAEIERGLPTLVTSVLPKLDAELAMVLVELTELAMGYPPPSIRACPA